MRRIGLGSIPGPPRYREALARFLSRIASEDRRRMREVIVFGSVARGEAAAESDVDVLVVWDGPLDLAYRRLVPVATEILIESGVDLSIHPFSAEEYATIRRMHTGFFENVEQEGLVVA